MHLSLLKLSRAQSKSLKITDTYSLHRIVYDCFEKQREDMQESSGILFSEIQGNALEKRIIILSKKEPLPKYECELQTKAISENYFDFPLYRFEVVVNPVKRENVSRRIIPMRKREDIATWFISRASKWGFSLQEDTLEILDSYVDTFKKNNQLLTLGKARVGGILKIEDKNLFLQSFSTGLGKGKAFGCGLLQLTPIYF